MAAQRRLRELVVMLFGKPDATDPRVQKAQRYNHFLSRFVVLFALAVGAVTPIAGDVEPNVRYIGFACVAALVALSGIYLFKYFK